MHAGVGIGVGKLEEIVAVKIRHFLTQPLVLHAVEIAVESEMLPK